MIERPHRGALISAGTLLGAGLGGFVDGIVFHQILQWHGMLSSFVEPVDLVTTKYNMVWDGFFHAFTWILTVAGLVLLWRAGQRSNVPWSTRTFAGSLALGWGLFNLVEGVIDHQLLGLHHVRPGPDELAWDVAFLVVGACLVAGGWALVRAGRLDLTARGVEPTRPVPKHVHEFLDAPSSSG
jgi:uncharacterized membrane protein